MSELHGAFEPAYGIPVLLALALALGFPASHHFEDSADRRQYRRIQLLTLLGALVGAKMAVLFGDRGWPMHPLTSHKEAHIPYSSCRSRE